MFSTSSQALGSYEAVCRRKQLEVLMGFIICFSSLHRGMKYFIHDLKNSLHLKSK